MTAEDVAKPLKLIQRNTFLHVIDAPTGEALQRSHSDSDLSKASDSCSDSERRRLREEARVIMRRGGATVAQTPLDDATSSSGSGKGRLHQIWGIVEYSGSTDGSITSLVDSGSSPGQPLKN